MIDATPARGGQPSARRPKDLLYSEGFRSAAYQIALAAAVVFVGLFLYQNVVENLQRQNIATGFGFLREVSQFDQLFCA
jgi:general L-amino acid transport system permease protein